MAGMRLSGPAAATLLPLALGTTVALAMDGDPPQFNHAIGWMIASALWAFGLMFGIRWLVLSAREEKRPPPTEHIDAQKYLQYMLHESEWGRRIGAFADPDFSKPGVHYSPPRALAAVFQFARQAKKEGTPIRAFGVLNGVGGAKPISHLFWMTNHLDPLATLTQYGPSRTEPGMGASGDVYEQVEIERGGVEQVWPRMNFFYRQLKRINDRREQRRRAKVEFEIRADAEPPQENGIHLPNVTRDAPPTKLTEQEVTKRAALIDEMFKHLHDGAIDSMILQWQDANRVRLIVTDQNVDVMRAHARKLVEAITAQEAGIAVLFGAYPMQAHIMPPGLTKFEQYKPGLQKELENVDWFCSRLPSPVQDKTYELIDKYCRYPFFKAAAQYQAWVKDRLAELRELHKATTRGLG